MGLLIVRLVELLIVIVPLIGVIFAGFKALSKVRDRQDETPAVGAPERAKSNKSAQRQAIVRRTSQQRYGSASLSGPPAGVV